MNSLNINFNIWWEAEGRQKDCSSMDEIKEIAKIAWSNGAYSEYSCNGCKYGSYNNIFKKYLPKDYQEARETCIRNMRDKWEVKE